MNIVPVVLAAYLVGTIPFALLLGRWFGGIDVRHIGSGNVGAANVARSGGIALALAVTALDAGKGAAAVWFAGWLAPGPVAPAVAGVAAIVGHVRPVWLRFRGGKGVATTGGVFAVLAPMAVAAATVVFVATVWITRYVSLGSLLAAVALPPLVYLVGAPTASVVAAVAVSAIVIGRHRMNLSRLLAGTERRLGQRA